MNTLLRPPHAQNQASFAPGVTRMGVELGGKCCDHAPNFTLNEELEAEKQIN